jgi:hypothetical protein
VISNIGIATLDIDGEWIIKPSGSAGANHNWRDRVGDVNDLEGITSIVSYVSVAALSVDGVWSSTGSHATNTTWTMRVRDIKDLQS